MSTAQNSQTVITVPVKSVGISLLLTFFLGPLGMLYSTIWGGIIMVATNSYNQKLLAGNVSSN